jgi:hypothetical protein
MPDAERHRRRAALAEAGSALPPTAWFQAQLDALRPVDGSLPGAPTGPGAGDGERADGAGDRRRPSFHGFRARLSGRIGRPREPKA